MNDGDSNDLPSWIIALGGLLLVLIGGGFFIIPLMQGPRLDTSIVYYVSLSGLLIGGLGTSYVFDKNGTASFCSFVLGCLLTILGQILLAPAVFS